MNTAQFNTARVLREIWLKPGISRVQIAENLQLDKSTISLIVAGLAERGLIKNTEENNAGPKGGRKKILLELNEHFGYIIGLEIQSDYYRLVVTNLKSEIVFSEAGPQYFNQGNLLYSIEVIISRLRANHGNWTFIGIAIGFTGIVNPVSGSIHYSIPLKINSPFQLTEELENTLKIPVLIENDANCGAWAELNASDHARADNFIFVLMKFWDTDHQQHFAKIGIGLGIVINGKVYHGNAYSAGEFKSIFGKGDTKSQFAISDEEIENIPRDPKSTKKLIRELAANMALIVNTFNMDKVIVGCDVNFQKELILKTLSAEITNNWHYPFNTHYELKFSEFSENIVARGAAMMFMERIFELSLDNQFKGIQYLDRNK